MRVGGCVCFCLVRRRTAVRLGAVTLSWTINWSWNKNFVSQFILGLLSAVGSGVVRCKHRGISISWQGEQEEGGKTSDTTLL